MTFAEFLVKIKTSPVELLGVIYHGEAGRRSNIGFGIMASGDHKEIRNISLQKIMDEAVRVGAKGMTLLHSHPRSNKPVPSEADLHTTYTIHDITKKDGVPVLDHIIFGAENSMFSFIQNGIEL